VMKAFSARMTPMSVTTDISGVARLFEETIDPARSLAPDRPVRLLRC
jgi:hypothetical protein